jgi:phosphatidylserine decarboxylase
LVQYHDETVPFFLSPAGNLSVITRYGYDVVGVVVILSVIGCLASWFLLDDRVFRIPLVVLLALLLLFTLYFFRDPERATPEGKSLVISPADGKVLDVREVEEPEYLKGKALQVSIFMSPLDVHVNRYPVSGVVEFFKHIPGEHMVAFDEKASLRNERTLIGISWPGGRMLFKQIAGFVARRIVAEVHEGDTTVAGTRFGMIKFGSRVDIFLPPSASIRVKPGERTVAGETVIAQIPTAG